MNSSEILITFNNYFVEFLDLIIELFPDDKLLIQAREKLLKLKKVNPKLIIKIWKIHILDKYKNEIMNNDLEFFLLKNYEDDVKNIEVNNTILDCINKFKEPIRLMSLENQSVVLNYVKNLSIICENY